MHVAPGIVTAVLATTVAAAAVVPPLVGPARRAGGAYRLLASGVGVAAVCLALGLAGLLGPGSSDPAQAGVVLAVGMSLSNLLCCTALLWLPAAGSRVATYRLLLDGLIIAAALWYVGWVLLTEQTRLLGAATPIGDPPTLLVMLIVAGSVWLALAVVTRVPRLHNRLLWLAVGIAATGCAGLALVAGLRQAVFGLAIAGGLLLAAALSVCVLAVGRPVSPALAEPGAVQQDNSAVLVPVLAMAVFAMYHLLRHDEVEWPAVMAVIVQALALVARQHLILRDVRGFADRLAQREAHFRELAHTDMLTGLANRRGLLHALRRSVELAQPCVLLGLDLDGFKNVNDLRGRDVGDAVLVEVGHRMRTLLHPDDLAVRLGGDEFAVLTRSEPAGAQRLAERLREVFSLPFEQPTGRVFLSVSIGLAGDGGVVEPELLLRNTDLALRHAKQRGKNRVERYDATYDESLYRRTRLEHELRGAIERDELRLAFQPVAAVPSARPVGAEALLRWRHHELGNVRPDEFIPLAEECGMIAKLGAWVLHEACRHLSRWLADGHDVWLSVNVSPRELHAPEYVDQVAEALRTHNVPPQRLVLEVTEHAVATDLNELIRRLAALRRTGVRIALDDFGAGYSSLGQLRRIPIDILKIDHSLVAEHEPVRPADQDGPAFAPMVDIVMRLGHQLGLEVIAEGVTSPAELAAVVAAGCRFGQGQLFGWGVPGEHLEAMLEAASSSGAVRLPAQTTGRLEIEPSGLGEGAAS